MKSLPLACALALAVGPAALADEPPPVESFRADLAAAEIAAGRAANTRSVAAQAFLYHLPTFVHLRQLTEFIQGRQYFFPKEAPLGGWVLVRQLADPKTDNVQPNVDTLYGASYLWLAEQGPVVLSVPAIADRYYSVAILDAWLNNFAYVGTRTTGTDAGDYLIVPPGWAGETPAGIRAAIRAPTPVINLFQRIFVRDTAPDLEAVRRLQDRIRLTPLADYIARTDRGFAPIDLKAFSLPGLRRVGDPLRFFELMSFYTAINRPPAEDGGLVALFSAAGIGPGSTLPADPSLREALVRGFADGRQIINAAISHGPFRNGWTVPDPNMGRPGPHLLTRAVTQMTAMGANVPEEAMYFTAHRDGSGAMLDGTSRYTLTFPAGRLPPVGRHGFWSVTLYNREGYLLDNPIARYVVRPDTAGLRYGADGSLTLHLQATRPAGEDAANWLPAPAGNFFVTLRTYLPDEAIVSGAWFPEAIKRQP
jgi:hypothetical protein